jgi:sulfate adenylyltransferase large subunit
MADLAVILIDTTKGLLPQTRRHAYIASLLGIPNLLAAINKMDLVAYQESAFRRLEREFVVLARHLGIPFVQCIPVSALEGDNLVTRSDKTLWYAGPTLLQHLETVPLRQGLGAAAMRFPVQSVIRPDQHFRGFSGRLASGIIRPGDAVLALPSGQQTRVQTIVSYDGDLQEAISPQSVVLKLEHEIDLSRGDMLVSPHDPPQLSRRFSAMVVWLNAKPMQLNQAYLAKHAGRRVKAQATRILFRIDVNNLTKHPANELEMNEIAAVEFQTSAPLFFDPYALNRTTGSFILIDSISNATVGAAMIREKLPQHEDSVGKPAPRSESETWGEVTRQERYRRHGHRFAIFSIVGNRAFAERLERALFERGFEAVLVGAEHVLTMALPPVLAALRLAGAVVIHSSETNSREQQVALAHVAGEFLFEIATAEQNDDGRETLKRALAIAETLRMSGGVAGEEKAGGNESVR